MEILYTIFGFTFILLKWVLIGGLISIFTALVGAPQWVAWAMILILIYIED